MIFLRLLQFVLLLHCVSAYRILAVLPFSGKSHYLNILPILQELSARGHELTVISPFRDDRSNFTQMVVKRKMLWDHDNVRERMYDTMWHTTPVILEFCWKASLPIVETFFDNDDVRDFIKNDKSHFDLVFTETFYGEAVYMFAHKYKAPLVGFATMGYMHHVAALMGSPIVFPYMVHEYTQSTTTTTSLTFLQRLENLYHFAYEMYGRRIHSLPQQQEVVERYFPDLPRPLPLLSDIEKNISVVFVSTHFSYDTVRPYVPGIVEVGGVHVQPAKPLPDDLRKFIEESKHGVIFFSFGSNLLSAHMPKDKLRVLLNVFGKLKQRILWKYEEDTLPGKPDNVMISKWLPQNDILAHPNVKLFITHGGLLSTQESMHHGVPVLAIPFVADQKLNAKRIHDSGYGLAMPFPAVTEANLGAAIARLVDEPEFRRRAAEVSTRFRDRPQSPLDTTVFWIEYVIRHRGAPHMRSPAKDIAPFVLYMWDVMLFVTVCLAALLALVVNVWRFVVRLLSRSANGGVDKKVQ